MTASTHIVLGGNGVIGRETLRALGRRGVAASSLGRRPSSVGSVRSVTADLLSSDDVDDALRGVEVAYLTAGLPYSTRAWQQQWPIIVRNVAEAALARGVRLVYFDNVYAYGAVAGAMTEETPIAPASRKGRVRAQALQILDDAVARGLALTVARSADFFGAGAMTSVFTTFALQRIAAGKTATWLYDADQPHSLTYTRDIGDALATLGTADAAGGVWHVPTAPALTGREYVRLAAGPGARVNVMGSATMRLGALFASAPRATLEMAYQYIAPYRFDSSRFEAAFGAGPTPTAEAIAETLGASRIPA